MDKAKPAPADYEVTQPREIGGVHRALGEILSLTPAQAKYYLPPHGTGLKPAAARRAGAERPAPKSDKAEG